MVTMKQLIPLLSTVLPPVLVQLSGRSWFHAKWHQCGTGRVASTLSTLVSLIGIGFT